MTYVHVLGKNISVNEILRRMRMFIKGEKTITKLKTSCSFRKITYARLLMLVRGELERCIFLLYETV